jgi:hypothetical protein
MQQCSSDDNVRDHKLESFVKDIDVLVAKEKETDSHAFTGCMGNLAYAYTMLKEGWKIDTSMSRAKYVKLNGLDWGVGVQKGAEMPGTRFRNKKSNEMDEVSLPL